MAWKLGNSLPECPADQRFQKRAEFWKTVKESVTAQPLREQGADPAPLTAALLGMGEDGHVASLFPRAPGLAAALASEAPPVVAMRAPDGEARLSLSAPVLRAARLLVIFITGATKRAVIEAAKGADPLQAPVAAFLDRAEVHWAE